MAKQTRPTRDRAARKELARRRRGEELRRRRRRATLTRAAWFAGVGVVALGVLFFTTRVAAPRAIPEAARAAARAAGCGPVQTPAASAPGGLHLSPGQSYTYDQHPATSGYHDPTPLPADPHVRTSPVDETRAVHDLEHGYVMVYYRADGNDALPTSVVETLAAFANAQAKVIMAPYPDLPAGTSLALAAWNKLWECPPAVTASQARTMVGGFVEAYRATSNAPEPRGA